MVLIEPLATMAAVEDFLYMRVQQRCCLGPMLLRSRLQAGTWLHPDRASAAASSWMVLQVCQAVQLTATS